ncbi:MAG: sulfatase-like hydrolase/transferase, partial [Segetibacter sp.]
DQGYADVSYNPYHQKEVHTPNVDMLAKSGIKFTSGYVSGFVCSPTRTGLMTGRYQHRMGLYTAGEAGSGVPLDEKFLPHYLKEAGYTSGAFGKWHLGLTPEYNPVNRGFDYFYGFMGRGAHDYFKLDNIEGSPLYRNLQPIKETPGYLTTKLTTEAVAFIERNKDKPFFAYVAFNAVHFPAQAPKKDIEKFDTGDSTRNILMAMLTHLDIGVGEIIKALKKNKVYENTIVIYLSDNGGAPNMHAQNEPLRGSKHLNYEGGIRVPFLMSWPSMIHPSQEINTPVISLDLLPAICAAAGVNIKKNKPVDGLNILPVALRKTNKLHDYLCWNGGDGQWAIRKDDWKIYGKNDQVELYNLKDDLGEKTNLIKENVSKAKELKGIYDKWLAQMPAHDNVKGAKRSKED